MSNKVRRPSVAEVDSHQCQKARAISSVTITTRPATETHRSDANGKPVVPPWPTNRGGQPDIDKYTDVVRL